MQIVDGVTLNLANVVGYTADSAVTLWRYQDKIHYFNVGQDEGVAAEDVEEFESTAVTIYFIGSLEHPENVVGVSTILLVDEEALSFIQRLEHSGFIELIL